VVTVGPIDLPSMPEGMRHEAPPEVLSFAWPLDAALRGFDVSVTDAGGMPLPRSVIHHLIGVNFDRRSAVYPTVERLFGWGAETEPVLLPSGVGVPLARGEHLGVYALLHNETGREIRSAYLRVTLTYTPATRHTMSVFPLYVDVNNVIGGVTTFDLPPGKSVKSYEFTFPIEGRLVAVGGHMHDYGTSVRLEDAASGKVLVRLKARRDTAGRVEGVGRFIWGFNGEGLRIEAGHRYRVVAVYENPTGRTIEQGGMGHINGVFQPDDIQRWPRLDLSDPVTQEDLATLPLAGAEPEEHRDRRGGDATPEMGSGAMEMDHPMTHGDAGHAPMQRDSSWWHGSGANPRTSAPADTATKSPR